MDWPAAAQRRAGCRLGSPIIYRDAVDSTNALAHRLVPDPAAIGAVIVANYQTAGRGRLARHWLAAPGAALTFTVVLGPVTPAWGAQMICGLSTLEAAHLQGVPAQLKWPNDLLVGGRKCAGILIETSMVGDASWLLAGIGLNVHAADPSLPQATALALHTPRPLSRTGVLLDLLAALEAWQLRLEREPAAVRAAWKDRLATLGQVVQAWTPAGVLDGLAYDVADDGALLLRLDDGSTRAIRAGDVTLSPVPPTWG